MRAPPLCPMAIVTSPLYVVTLLPSAFSAVTSTGPIVMGHGSEVLGCAVKANCVTASPSVSTEASHVLGALKSQVHCGLTGPVAAGTTSSPSAHIDASDIVRMLVKPAGGAKRPDPFDMLTPYTSEPAPTDIAPGLAVVMDKPEPNAELCWPNACV